MPVEESDVYLAARLVALGFPGDHALFADERAAALERWHSGDPGFQRACAAVARGLGVHLYQVTAEGSVVLLAEPGTPFTPRVDDLLPANVRNDRRRRQLAVLALVAVVAELYPTEEALAAGDADRDVHAEDVVNLLTTRADEVALEPRPALTADAPDSARDVAVAFALVRELQVSAPTAGGAEMRATLTGIVESVLTSLVEMKLLRASDAGSGRKSWRPTSTLLPHVRHLLERGSVDDLLTAMRGAPCRS